MAWCEVYAQPVKLKYKSTVCSKSTVFAFFTTVLSFLLPLLVGYRSQGFWLRNAEYREQPTIQFKHDYLMYIETDRPDRPILCSNLPFTKEFDRCSVIKSREEDNNRDGKYDELLMEIEVDMSSNIEIYTIYLIIVFDYVLQKQCLLQMESLGIVQFTSGLPGSRFDYTGDLRLVQKQLLVTRGRDLRYNHSVFIPNDNGEYDFNLNRIIRNYAKRTVSTRLDNSYQMWTSGVLLNEPFRINLNINYPEESVKYKPSFWHVMKWAWIQYFSLLFIFLNLFQRVKCYVFSNHIIPTMKDIPWKKTS
ncbi:hypothetical protein RUM44_003436 [Polyplax serrata]|uniref:Transmembrane protein 231 n=1 Tax=Polyplax serrata TaxID=468196 RepID=A0ABR1AGL3_POLSC